MELTTEQIKELVGKKAADLVKPGMKLGLGTGSTVFYLLKELGQRKLQGLEFSFVPTSKQTETIAIENGLTLLDINIVDQLDLCIDGADEIDPAGNLIKGGGGALLQEKIVAAAAVRLAIIADGAKIVKQLGKFPLPIEVIPFGYTQVEKKVKAIGAASVQLRIKDGGPFITDHQHYILDCYFETISDCRRLNSRLLEIPGVVETGLFIGMATQAIVGNSNGSISLLEFAH